jgi:hypothetical protein
MYAHYGPLRQIIFYKTDKGKCPVEEYLGSLSNKHVEKVFFVLDLVERMPTCPATILKNLSQPMKFGRFESISETISLGYLDFGMVLVW